MPNREHKNKQNSVVHLIDHAIIAYADSPSIGDTFHLPASGRKWVIP
jgi:hypothetical protein